MKITSFPLTVLLVIGFTAGGLAIGAADLVVKNAAGDPIASLDAGSTITQDPRLVDIRIENTGAVAVENLTSSVTGLASADFSLVSLSATTIPAMSEVTAKIRFAPQDLGTRSAQLMLASSSPAPVQVTLDLAGTGTTVFEPIFRTPADVPVTTTPFNLSNYSIGTVTILFKPRLSEELTVARSFTGAFTNGSGPVQVNYGGKTYLYQLLVRPGPPPSGILLNLVLMSVGGADSSFIHPLNGGGGTIAIQADGKLIVTGNLGDVAGRNRRIVRLNTDGTVDPTFNASVDDLVPCVFIQPDGKILLAGFFTTVNGVARQRLARLHPDGTLDHTFVAPQNTGGERIIGLPDGKVLVAGSSGVVRLNADGSIDETFDAELSGSGVIYGIAAQKDGKILAGGPFGVGDDLRYLTRFNSDGSLDTSFPSETNSTVSAMIFQPDGKLVIGGHFTQVNGQPRSKIARLNADGTLDASFSVDNAVDGAVSCLALQTDGRILIGGPFDKVAGSTRYAVARLEADGTHDETFAPSRGADTVDGIVIEHDGAVLVNGSYTTFDGVTKGVVKFLNNPGASDFSVIDGDSLRWTRTGSVPELLSVHFEGSTNGGVTWDSLGEGTRVSDGWILDNVILPPAGFLRAKGRETVSNRGFGVIQETKLVGREPSALEIWRTAQFGTPTNEGPGSDGNDYDHDGHSNLVEYAFALNPKLPDVDTLPVWYKAGDAYEMSVPKYLTIDGITYHPEWSETMRADDWHPGDTVSDPNHNIFRIPIGTEERRFFRVRVGNP